MSEDLNKDIAKIMASLYAPSKRSLDAYFYGTKEQFERMKQALVRIANAKGFDNIGNYARNEARRALGLPLRAKRVKGGQDHAQS